MAQNMSDARACLLRPSASARQLCDWIRRKLLLCVRCLSGTCSRVQFCVSDL